MDGRKLRRDTRTLRLDIRQPTQHRRRCLGTCALGPRTLLTRKGLRTLTRVPDPLLRLVDLVRTEATCLDRLP